MGNVLKIFGAASLWAVSVAVAGAVLTEKVESFPVSDVRLTESVFKRAEDLDVRYLLGLDPDRLLAPYLKEAGLTPKAENYPNWENTGLDGHIGGHYLSALAYMYAATGNEEIGRRLDYMLAEMKRCQEAAGDGYLCGVPGGRKIWKEISEGNIRANSFGLNDRWVPLYNIHKTYAGLRDAYLVAGRKEAKDMFVALVDWMEKLTVGLSDDQMQDMLRSEHGGLNEVMADAADMTGDKRYLGLAHRFSHRAILEPLMAERDELTGKHANTQIPKVIGFKRIADLEGSEDWDRAARFFWETVVDHRSISIGGNSVREHFHPADDFTAMMTSEQGPETCNTYNMLRLTKMLYQTSADVHYMDFYERALYNHILSTIDPVQGGFVYFTPMRPGHYRVYSQPQTSFWCCVGSGMENHARYGEMIYAHEGDDELYVNLFIPSVLTWGKTKVQQVTNFPESDRTALTFTMKKARRLKVKFRVPEWTDAAAVKAMVNGHAQQLEMEDGYAEIEREWKNGDRVELTLPMSLRVMQLPDGSPNYSFLYGPVVLAADMGHGEQDGLFADDSRGGHIAAGRQWALQDMPVLVGQPEDVLKHVSKVDDRPLTFRLSGVSPARYEGLKLVPFNRLYECRYMVYWPLVSAGELKAKQEALARAEQERRMLESATADKVICGEQQPESDHFVRMKGTQTGSDNDRHWRKAAGQDWFEYRMRTGGRKIGQIRVEYQAEKGTAMTVQVNGRTVLTAETTDGQGMKTLSVNWPADAAGVETVTVRFMPGGQKPTPRIYEIRLMDAAR